MGLEPWRWVCGPRGEDPRLRKLAFPLDLAMLPPFPSPQFSVNWDNRLNPGCLPDPGTLLIIMLLFKRAWGLGRKETGRSGPPSRYGIFQSGKDTPVGRAQMGERPNFCAARGEREPA